MTQSFDPYAPPPEDAMPHGAVMPSATPLYDAYQSLNQARRLRVPEGLATAVVVLSSVFLAGQLLATVLSFDAAEAYTGAADPMDVYTAYDAVSGLLAAVMLAAFIVSCLWLNESRKFAVVVKPYYHHQRGPVWVWLGWVVPIVSLWFPYQVVRDIRRSTIRESSGLAGWWSTWLIANFFSYQSTQVTLRGDDGALLPGFEVITAVTLLIAFVCWLRIVRELTVAQRAHVAAAQGHV
ncbi:DUF4328 domain-containing protein [Promicromonospora sp. NPDC050262]|uniref:DUF4328 domain-containing protein n=1 Tax=Promicromonospora sp. NPDC050262 TaxID=3155036 RepID=UPI0033C86A87